MKRITLRETPENEIPTPLPGMVGLFVNASGQLCRIDENDNISEMEGLVSMSATPPASGGVAAAGVANTASRGDHVHPAVDLTDLTETSGALPLARGGLGVSLADPNADRIAFWDDSAGQFQWLDLGANLSITGTTLNTTGLLASSALGVTVQAHSTMLDDIGALSDPNADRIPFWDDSAGHIVWLTLGAGLNISGTTMTASGGGGGGSLVDGDYGDITVGGTGTTMTIDNATVSLAKMANLAANSFIGNNTGSGATPIALTVAQAKTLLAIATGDVSGLGSLATQNTINGGLWSGTDLGLADGGTGASLTDPNADRIMFWDDSAGTVAWLTAGTGLDITGTTISVVGSGATWTQIGSTLTTSGAGPWAFTGIPGTYSDLMVRIKFAATGSGLVYYQFSPDGSNWSGGDSMGSALSDGNVIGDLTILGYTNEISMVLPAATKRNASSPTAVQGVAPRAAMCTGGMTAVRIAVEVGVTASSVSISLWGR